MKILLINFEYPPLGGGGGVATKDVAQELARRHEVHVITTWYTGLPRQENSEGVLIHRVPVLGRFSLPTATLLSMITFAVVAAVAGWRLCRKTSFDVINAQFVVPSGIPALLLARWFNVPFVLSFIGGDIYDPTKGVSPHRHWWLRALIRTIAHSATEATAISTDTKRRAQDLHGVTTPITVTHLGLTPMTVPTLSRAEAGLPVDHPLFISVGRLIPRKGYDVLLTAWKDISYAHLVIVGSGPWEEKLKKLTRRLGLTDRVHFTGFVSEERKRQLLRLADGYISAAEHEGFGIVFLEAMEAGLPIIATNNGGHTDFLKPDHNALLVPPGQAEALRQAVQQLLADQALRQQLAQYNQQTVPEFYLDKTTRRFEAVLTRAIDTYANRS